jgi:iron complex outermembrane receptor protein
MGMTAPESSVASPLLLEQCQNVYLRYFVTACYLRSETTVSGGGRVKKKSAFIVAVICTISGLDERLACAQTALEAGSVPRTAAESAVSEIVVTGSRLARPDLDQPSLLSTVSAEQIANSGSSDLGDAIRENPAIGFSGSMRENSTTSTSPDNAGLSQIDLRNLGVNRTLVLVDGVRHVSGTLGSAAVDLNSIPPALVDHVEVITGGTSAIYGSDAVSGVVNIITKKTFTGVDADVKYGRSSSDGSIGGSSSAHLTVGSDFGKSGGNLSGTIIYDRQDAVFARDVKGFYNYGKVVNPNDCAPGAAVGGVCTQSIPNDGIPDFIVVPNVLSTLLSRNTVLLDARAANPSALFALNAAGQPVPATQSIAIQDPFFSQVVGPCATTCYNLEQDEVLSPKISRKGLDLRGYFPLGAATHLRLDAKFIRTNVESQYYSNFTVLDHQLQPDNAFITAPIAQQLTGIASAEYPFIDRELADLGIRGDDITRDTYRIVASLDGALDAHLAELAWKANLNFGETHQDIDSKGLYIPGNLDAALDSVLVNGKPVCRVNAQSAQPSGYTSPADLLGLASSCVPYNPFGQQNSAAALEYLRYAAGAKGATLTQMTADFGAVFDTGRFLVLPGGPIGVALGTEFRRETSRFVNDPTILRGITSDTPVPDQYGQFHVTEGYIEVSAPIVKNQPWLNELSLDAAGRTASYSTVGQQRSYHVGFVLAPIRDLRLRGTYSSAIRAPNISEEFTPASAIRVGAQDPCDRQFVGLNPNRAANCTAAGVPSGFVSDISVAFPGLSSGNQSLSPEKSESLTLGAVYQPGWVTGLAATVDFFRINIKNAIELLDPQTIINNCYDSTGGPDATYCSLIHRDGSHNLNFARTTYVNASSLHTSGIDTRISYTADELGGRIGASASVSYLNQLHLAPFQDDPAAFNRLDGEVNTPRWRGLINGTYTRGSWSFALDARIIGTVALFVRDPLATYPESTNIPYLGTYTYWDGTASWSPESVRGLKLTLGVDNLFDKGYPAGVFNRAGTSAGSYDILGRYVFVRVGMRR